jgi:purine-binding chemotaxis protein CheW
VHHGDGERAARRAPEPELLAPDLARLQPLDALDGGGGLDARGAAPEGGGELTPIPELPPWQDALDAAAYEPAERIAAGSTPLPREPTPAWPTPAWPSPAVAPADPLDEFFYREDEEAPGLLDLDFAKPKPAAPAEAVDPLREYLTFFLGFEEYAIEIERVREVLKAPAITDVPRAPRHVLGVIMIRGDVIAVFDPRRRLGLPEVDRTAVPRVLVCDDGLGPIGLLVDAVSQVVRLRRSEIEPRPQGVGNVSAEYISGIGRQAGRMLIVLDLPVVLRGKAAGAAEAA